MFVRTAIISASALLLATVVLADDEKTCYEIGERAIGSKGEKFVQYLPCCNGEKPSFVQNFTGKWCGGVSATVEQRGGTIVSTAGASNSGGGGNAMAFSKAFRNGGSGGGSGGGFSSGPVTASAGGGGGGGSANWMEIVGGFARYAVRFVHQFEGAAKARYSDE